MTLGLDGRDDPGYGLAMPRAYETLAMLDNVTVSGAAP